MRWLVLVLSLPTENATARMRAWRALRSAGAAVLRDGVYLLLARDECRLTLETIADDVGTGGGITHLLPAEEPSGAAFAALFDRTTAYAALLDEIGRVNDALDPDTALETFRQARKLRKTTRPSPRLISSAARRKSRPTRRARTRTGGEPGAYAI